MAKKSSHKRSSPPRPARNASAQPVAQRAKSISHGPKPVAGLVKETPDLSHTTKPAVELSDSPTTSETSAAANPLSQSDDLAPPPPVDDSGPHSGALPVVQAGVETETAAPLPIAAEPTPPSGGSERKQIVRGASLVMIGNLGSSLLGMVRQIVVTSLGKDIAGPFLSAILPTQTFNDFLVNGSVNGALIPTFSDYAAPEKRHELRRLVFTLVNIILLIMFAVAVAYAFLAPWIVSLMVPGYSPADKELTIQFSRIIFFSALALGPFSVLLAALYALREFGWPAFATSAYHLGIILGAIVGSLVGARFYGNLGMAFGVLVGAVGEILLLIPGIRKHRLSYMFVLNLRHPALPRILKLYAPVALSYLIMNMGMVFLDQYLASLTPGDGAANYTAMQSATRLIQFPIGLVAAALSIAVLPTLSRMATAGEEQRFKETLLLGLRLGLLLMIPATIGLIVLRVPISDLLYQHGKYTPRDAQLVSIALLNYAYQLPFVVIDQLLIAAFYARKNTIVPVTVGFISLLGYLGVALPFWQTIGMPALVLANTTQNSLHGIILFILYRIWMGPMHIRQALPALFKILVAGALMALVAWGLLAVLGQVSLFSLTNTLGALLTVLIAGGAAAGVYIGGVLLLRVEEVSLVKDAVLAKLGRKAI